MVSATTTNDESGSRTSALTQAGPLVPRMLLGRQLRVLREERGISREHAGKMIRASRSKLSRLELGRSGCQRRDLTDLLDFYGVHDEAQRSTLLALADEANAPVWWSDYQDVVPSWLRSYLSAEQEARLIRCFEVQFVPGLLQTEAYAREVIKLQHRKATEEELRRRVELRMRRQRILRRRPRPVNLWAVLDEAVLRRPIGGAAAMRDQLKHIIEACWRPNVTVQIAPFSIGGHAAAGGPVTLVRFLQSSMPDMVYLEQLHTAVYPEKPAEIEHHWHAFNTLVTEAAPPEHTPEIIRRILAGY